MERRGLPRIVPPPSGELRQGQAVSVGYHAWLRDTDWLCVVIPAARARKLKVGVEVSHTYLPREIFAAHPEYRQRDLNGKPLARPCPNHPDVLEYLLSLYGDLADRYDVDFVQTCLRPFEGGGRGGAGGYSRISYIKYSSFGYDHLIVKQKTGEIIVDGKGVLVYVDPKTRKSTSLPESFIEKVKAFEPSVKILREVKKNEKNSF